MKFRFFRTLLHSESWKQNEKVRITAPNETKIDENFKFDTAYIRFFNAEVELKVIEELIKNYTLHFKSESQDLDSTGRILDTISKLVESVQEEFEHLIGADLDKKNLHKKLN